MIHLPVNTLLQGGKYRIVRFINSGGFGCTYEAEHLMFRKRVAIKEFFVKDFCGRDERTAYVTVETTSKRGLVDKLKRKFIDEARSIFDLHHPGVVRVTDVFEENDTAYYVMDYIAGMSLKEIVDKEGALSEARALGYIRQVADALDYVHAHNRLHLDIKPGNIMIDDNDRAILIDFGASRQYEEVGAENTSSLIPYTNGYAPPEQVGSELVQLTPSSDLYALGATLYCLLSGSAPLSSNLRNSGEKLQPLPSGTSRSVLVAVDKCMKLNRYERLQNVESFQKELEFVEPKKWVKPLVVCLVTALCFWGLHECIDPKPVGGGGNAIDSLSTDTLVQVDSLPVVSPIMANPVEPIKDDIPSIAPLYVSTSPVGATVYVDGKKIGKSPLEGKEVSRGKHTVKLVLDGYEPFSKQYTFGDKPVIINESLVAVPARVPVQEAQLEPVKAATTGSINGHEWVDLGLSVKWATMNVGASSSGDYGDYFAWGEVHPKSEYTEKNSRTYGMSMGAISGNSQYDAACYHWGGSWRLPTMKELEELNSKCLWTRTKQDGHNGYKVVGPNGNSIFLPAAGSRYGTSTSGVGLDGGYWSGSPDDYGWFSYGLYFYDDKRVVDLNNRYYGPSVRPVSD